MEDALFEKGKQQIQAQDYAGAIATFTELIQANAFYGDAYYHRGVAYHREGHLHAAVSNYSKVLDLNGKHAKAYYGRGLARVTLKNPMGALKDADQAIRWQQDYAAAYELRATIHRRQGDYPKAIADFKDAAKFYLEQRKAELAKDCIASAEKIKSQLHQTRQLNDQRIRQESWTEKYYFHHILNLVQVGDTHRAMADISWVLRSDPQDARAYCCRGLVYLRQGDPRAAIKDFNHAIALNFQEAIVYRSRSQARLQLEDYAGAVQDGNQALSIQKEALSFVARGNAYRMMQDYMRAIEDYDAALGADPNSGEAHLERGVTYEALGKFQEAMVDYQQAIRLFCTQENWMGHKQAQARLQVAQKGAGTSPGKANGQGTYAQRTYAQLYKRLLALLDGNRKITEAILKRKKMTYPGRSEKWYVKSALEDLEKEEIDFWGKF